MGCGDALNRVVMIVGNCAIASIESGGNEEVSRSVRYRRSDVGRITRVTRQERSCQAGGVVLNPNLRRDENTPKGEQESAGQPKGEDIYSQRCEKKPTYDALAGSATTCTSNTANIPSDAFIPGTITVKL